MGNTFGHLFRVTTWGESHGAAIGAVIDGCPSRMPLSEGDIQPDLDRRAPGQSALVTDCAENREGIGAREDVPVRVASNSGAIISVPRSSPK